MNEWLDPAKGSSHIVFQVITLPLVTLLFVRCVYRLFRRPHSRVGALAGAVIWLCAGAAIVRPEVTNKAAELLGIGRGADLLLYLLAIAFLAAVFYFYQKHQRLESDLTRVVRSLALQEGAQRGPRDGGSSRGANRNSARDPGATAGEDS